MAHFTREPCEAAEVVAPETPCSHSDWRILWVPTGPVLHDVKMSPYTFVGRYACDRHEDLYWTGVRKRLQKEEREESRRKTVETVMTLF